MARFTRFTIPAGKAPVIQDGRLVGLTPAPTTSKVTPMTDTQPWILAIDPGGTTGTVLGRPLTTREKAEAAAYRAAYAALETDLGRPPTTDDDGYWALPRYTAGDSDPELVEQIARDKALADGREYVAPEAPAEPPSAPAEAPAASVKAKATPDAAGVIYVPGKVCRDCGARIERKPGAGRPPAKCLACRAVDATAAEAKAARKRA